MNYEQPPRIPPMDGFHHERIGAQFYERGRINLMSCRNQQSADLIDRLRIQPKHFEAITAPARWRPSIRNYV